MKLEYGQDRWWWLADEDDKADKLFTEVDRVSEDTVDRAQSVLEASALYGDLAYLPGYSGVDRVLPISRRISHNVIATATDALVAEVTQTKPRPMAITIGGDYTDHVRARKLTEYWDAKFQETNVYEIGRQAVRDAIISGLGILRAYRARPGSEHDKVLVERIWPGSFVIDDRGAVDVIPRSCYIRRQIDRSYLENLYPDKVEDIQRARHPEEKYWFTSTLRDDLVEVIEGWHLPSGPDGKDGRHTIAVSTTVLFDEDYDDDEFPLAFVRPVPPQRGFWGESIVKRAATAQFELNKLLRRVQESMHLHAVPRVFVNRGAGIVKPHYTNDIGILIEYDGQPPVYMTPNSMSADVYAHIDRLENWIYKEMGISQLSASSLKPAGLNSGRALRVYNDTQSRRFINLERSYEQMNCAIAMQITALERDISIENPKHEVVYESRGQKMVIPFREIDLKKGIMRTQVMPTSALPTSPAAKLQDLQEMVAAGTIDQETFLTLADVPDFESIRDTVVAPLELLEKRFDEMLETGKYTVPEPYMDLVRGMKLCALYIQKSEVKGASDDRLDLLRQWLGDAKGLIDGVTEQAQRAQMEQQVMMQEEQMAMAQPPGGPAATPPMAGSPAAVLPGSEEPMAGTEPAAGVGSMVQ
jgi:hypothetical protein